MKVLKVRKAAFWLALAAAWLGTGTLHAQSGFQVIVNQRNGVRSMSKAQLSDLFLRQRTQWDNGEAVIPVDLPDQSPVREAFSESIHGKSAAQVKAYWQRQVFSGRQVPPAERASAQEVIALVEANPNAIGYVAAGSALPSGVRALEISGAGAGDASAPEVYQIGAVDLEPQLVSSPTMRYPTTLRRNKIEGDVRLQFVVDQTGRVDASTIEVLESTVSAFERPAIDAVRRSSFRPGRLQGRSVAVQVQQTVRFRLSSDG